MNISIKNQAEGVVLLRLGARAYRGGIPVSGDISHPTTAVVFV